MNKKAKIGIIAAFVIALLLLGFMPYSTDQKEAMDESHSEGGDSSALTGMALAWGKLTDDVGNTLWKSADERYNLPESVVDPASGKEAVNFVMGFSYDADGTNMDWSSVEVRARWEAFLYRSPNAEKVLGIEWDSKTLTAQQNGDLESIAVAIEPLVPEKVIMIWHDYDPETGRKFPVTEIFYQKGTESHPFELVFYGHYYFNVTDIYGHTYAQYYRQDVTLTLQWVGTESIAGWSATEDEEAASTGAVPSITHMADVVCIQGNVANFLWVVDDLNDDLETYTVSVDGTVWSTGAFGPQGGTLEWSGKITTIGHHTVQVSVTDLQGNKAIDEVVVWVVLGGDDLDTSDTVEPQPPITPDPLDPVAATDGEQVFERDTGNGVGMAAGSVFGGSGNAQVLLLLGVAAGTGWCLYQRKQKKR